MATLTLYRVSYGKQTTPKNKREYVSTQWGSPVGTKSEWKKWFKGRNTKLKFKESPKKMIFIEQ